MTILDEIVAYKKNHIAEAKQLFPVKLLQESQHYTVPPLSLQSYLRRDGFVGIIAEIKRRSPSKGVFKKRVDIEALSTGYMQAGASALSILTDKNFFNGKNEDLTRARAFNLCPILRKDFVIDEYQVHEAKAIGADAILLIAAILTPKQIQDFSALAHGIGLEVLLEIHAEAELEKLGDATVDAVGVNNRNLKTFDVDITTCKELFAKLPENVVAVAESGISDAQTIKDLRDIGYQGFLIGEAFMSQENPAKACAHLVRSVKEIW